MMIRSRWLSTFLLAALSALIMMPTAALADDHGNRGQGHGAQQSQRGNDDHPGRGNSQARQGDNNQRGQGDDNGARARAADNDDQGRGRGRDDDNGVRTRVADDDDHGRGRGRDDDGRGRNDDDLNAGARLDNDNDDHGRQLVCHWTGSDTNPFVVLSLPAPAVRAHERHGDVVIGGNADDAEAFCGSQEHLAGALNTPSSVAVTGVTDTTATLAWPTVPNAVSFQVLVSTNPNGPFVPANVLSLTPNGATVGGLTPGVTYYFRVHSVDASGVASPVSNTIAVTAGSPTGGTLVPPTGLTVFNVTPTTATLAWSPVAGAQGYIVLQATTPGGPFVPSAVINMTSNGATVVGLAHGTMYFFEVRAVDTVGFQTAPSNLASATTLI